MVEVIVIGLQLLLIPARRKPLILEGEFTVKLLKFKRFRELSADGLSSPLSLL